MIYLDNAATTPVYSEVYEAMMPYLTTQYGNPSSAYQFGRNIKKAIYNAKEIIASSLNAEPDEIFFTSGATESNNWVLYNELLNYEDPFVITTTIEHPSILNALKALIGKHCFSDDKDKYALLYVERDGIVMPQRLQYLLDRPASNDCLVSVMFANNEIGTIQPIAEIGRLVKKAGCRFHTDATQAYCHVPIDVRSMNIDYLSASGHKINAPKGIGFLYINKTLQYAFSPFLFGGHQEEGYRAGTENVASIVGLAKAVEIHQKTMEQDEKEVLKKRQYCLQKLILGIDGIKINGGLESRLAGNINIRIHGINANELIAMLDERNICISAGSACHAHDATPSHVLKAIGLSDKSIKSSIRVTISRDNTYEELDKFIDAVIGCIKMLRYSNN